MAIFRDSFETCPRCTAELADARAARGCPACGGLWVQEDVVHEMILAMLPPQPLSRLHFAVLDRADARLPCPSCGEAMEPIQLLHVPLDRCHKHGVWFDRDELAAALYAVTQPGMPPALVELSATEAVHPTGRGYRVLRFTVDEPGEPSRSVDVGHDIVKLGRLQTAHVRVSDPTVARMHAVIENGARLHVIDLGSAGGTFVNDTRVSQHDLHSGDRIRIGATTLVIAFDGR